MLSIKPRKSHAKLIYTTLFRCIYFRISSKSIQHFMKDRNAFDKDCSF